MDFLFQAGSFIIAFILLTYVTNLAHELGHVVVGRAFGLPLYIVTIGLEFGLPRPPNPSFRLFNTEFYVGKDFLYSYAPIELIWLKQASSTAVISTMLAGPLAGTALTLVWMYFTHGWAFWMGAFFIWVHLGNLWPKVGMDNSPNDGLYIQQRWNDRAKDL